MWTHGRGLQLPPPPPDPSPGTGHPSFPFAAPTGYIWVEHVNSYVTKLREGLREAPVAFVVARPGSGGDGGGGGDGSSKGGGKKGSKADAGEASPQRCVLRKVGLCDGVCVCVSVLCHGGSLGSVGVGPMWRVQCAHSIGGSRPNNLGPIIWNNLGLFQKAIDNFLVFLNQRQYGYVF